MYQVLYFTMDIIERLKQIKQQGNFTQQKLSYKLNVSFQTVNSWLLKKSAPRKKHQDAINDLYFELFGLDSIDVEKLQKIKEKVYLLEDRYWFENISKSKAQLEILLLKLTYHSNSIEGSTLTEADTEAILFEKKVIANRSIIEQLEAINHQKTFYLALELVKKKKLAVSDILELHKILMMGILDNSGVFRNHPVRILGSFVLTENHLSIEKRISEFLLVFNKKEKDTILHLANTHAIFEQIHPFSDGNGRVGRLLMLILALKNGLPPVLVLHERKKAYYRYLQNAQLSQEYDLLSYFIAESILETVKYL